MMQQLNEKKSKKISVDVKRLTARTLQFVDENDFRTASKAVVVSHFLNETGAHVLLDRRIMRIVDGERGGGRNDRISALGGETW